MNRPYVGAYRGGNRYVIVMCLLVDMVDVVGLLVLVLKY